MQHGDLPGGLALARTTDIFDSSTVPAGLLRAHRVADGVWGRLVVHSGPVRFVWEDGRTAGTEVIELAEGDSLVIAPQVPHRVELTDTARFAVEFHRPGKES